ncbi:LysR family transcriptional regulator [Pseudomonas mangiferae]|uniref:LysR family transcriptional regulator n=1 Tax=Pseudomonas mangiferae TaxID=2593654 RepID=A0A553GVN6_9PSED|nr:LysR family transcriptional regulator [Pseudomonas mangiferae]TRX73516.1 LysR family transcriptional regulator [Pseudomonas mangiferae]
MDRLLAMQVFVRIVELGAFGKAADSLGLSRASVTALIKQLEGHLGVQLLQRTTRQVAATLDGQAYYERCLRLLADLEEAESCFSTARGNPQGVLRVDLPASLGRLLVIPALPAFCARYPRIQLEIGASDRPVDLIREGVDCVLRAGDVHDQSLVARPLGSLVQLTCASADYLRRHGRPETLEQLEGHVAVDFLSALSGRRFDLAFVEHGAERCLRLPSRVAVSSADAYVAACEAGLGLIQVPRYHVAAQLAAGTLCEVLEDCRPAPLALTVLYPRHRQLSRRVRVFVDWLAERFPADPGRPPPGNGQFAPGRA